MEEWKRRYLKSHYPSQSLHVERSSYRIAVAEEWGGTEQYPDAIPISDNNATVEKYVDEIYNGLDRAKQEYEEKPVEEICKLAIKFGLYPWEMMEAANLEHGVHPDEVI